jgi:hypothetical protein
MENKTTTNKLLSLIFKNFIISSTNTTQGKDFLSTLDIGREM